MSTPSSPRDRARQRLTMDYPVDLVEAPKTRVVLLPQPAGKRRQEAENDDQPA